MGFSQQLAEFALVQNKNNLEQALDYLFSNDQDMVMIQIQE